MEKNNCCPMCKLVEGLVIVGAFNWLLVAIFNYNLIAVLFGQCTSATWLAYVLIGLSGFVLAVKNLNFCACTTKNTCAQAPKK